jgi:hypothetical protein
MVAIPKLDVAYFFVNTILNCSCHSKVFKLRYIYKGLTASFTKDLLSIFKHGHKLSNNSQYFPLRLQGWTCCSLNFPQIKSLYLVQVVQLISVFTTFRGAGNVLLWLTDTHYTHQHFTHCALKFYKFTEPMGRDSHSCQIKYSSYIMIMYCILETQNKCVWIHTSSGTSHHVKWYKWLPVNTE